MKKIKLSRAAKAAISAFRGLQADEEDHVLRALGFIRDPTALGGVNEDQFEMIAESVASFDIAEFAAADGPSIGLPHPDLMTDEQKALNYPKREKADDSRLLKKLTRSHRLRRTK